MPERLRLIVGQCTDPGLQRKVNEDSLAVPTGVAGPILAERGHLYVVADGVGGRIAGATASRLAVETVLREYYHGPFADVPTALVRAIEAANQVILTKAQEPAFAHMGTTLVAAVVRNAELTVAHVGDSRAYLVNQAGIHQLTEDHTWVAEQRRAGILTDEEARQHSQRHILTRSLGKPGAVPDITRASLQPGDAVLLCTDGLSNLVSAAELHQFISSYPPPAAAAQLISLANQRGGPDNITAVVVQVGSAPVAAQRIGVVGATLNRLSARLAALPPTRLAVAVIAISVAGCLMLAGVVSLLGGPGPSLRPTSLSPGAVRTLQLNRTPLPTRTAALETPTVLLPTQMPGSPSPEEATPEGLLETPGPEASPVVPTGTLSPVSTSLHQPTPTPAPSNIGVIVPHHTGGEGIFLLNNPYREKSGIVWLPNGSRVEILNDNVSGFMIYGSSRWYRVRCVVEGKTYTGYVPAAVVRRQP